MSIINAKEIDRMADEFKDTAMGYALVREYHKRPHRKVEAYEMLRAAVSAWMIDTHPDDTTLNTVEVLTLYMMDARTLKI